MIRVGKVNRTEDRKSRGHKPCKVHVAGSSRHCPDFVSTESRPLLIWLKWLMSLQLPQRRLLGSTESLSNDEQAFWLKICGILRWLGHFRECMPAALCGAPPVLMTM